MGHQCRVGARWKVCKGELEECQARKKKEKSERKKVNTIGVLSVREKKKRDDWRE